METLSGFIGSLLGMADNILVRQALVVLAYAVAAKAADLFIDRILKKLAGLTRLTLDDLLIRYLHLPICVSILLVGVLHALALSPLAKPWGMLLPAAVKSVILIVWFVAGFRLLQLLIDKSSERFAATGSLSTDLFLLFKNVARVVLFGAGLFWLLAIWRVNLTPLFASAGIAGIAVALAAKDTLANFFGGISIFADRTFKVGDYIILDNAERGEVVEIGIRSTRIKTRDDVLITIPNSLLATSKIINESAPVPRFRIRIPVGVAYGSDVDQVERVLLQVAAENPKVSKEPEPRVRFRAFGESSLDFELLLWVDDPALKGLVTHELLKSIYKAFEKQGITIPFPQRDVHLYRHDKGNANA